MDVVAPYAKPSMIITCLVRTLSATEFDDAITGKDVNKRNFVRLLATSITCGKWDTDSIAKRIKYAVDIKKLNTALVAKSIQKQLSKHPEPNIKQVEEALLHTQHFTEWLRQEKFRPKSIKINLDTPVMRQRKASYITEELPRIATLQELSSWLNLSVNDLAWLADTQNRQAQTYEPKLHHYHYQWLKQPHKAPRLLETPKSCLKSVQRQILHQILDKVAPHNAAHGFVKNRSCKTYAQEHTQQDMLLHMDLKNFFTSITQQRIYALFYALGYPKKISRTLCALCTHTPNSQMLGNTYHQLSWEKKKLILQPHLPQGAPTSPALANLCCLNLDNRLHNLTQKLNIKYTRYADDLAFSGKRQTLKSNIYLRKIIERIAQDEGFLINHEKTYTSAKSQQQSLVGIVVNEHPNISRKEYDRLKAILHNCKTFGIETQNRDKHHNFKEYLRGKIAHVNSVSPLKGEKLYSIFSQLP